ncbi:unnamed protein product [Nippostrongylus brasiliensis]|uniref:DUF4220 domain-containing protein n=1 Tax=Nippostrongylus brasiliensis TaxID=27835 RepID=A0A0N4Y069_NIPBR|nr:unnamed protein product [Nippostrongylus brasiliensis]
MEACCGSTAVPQRTVVQKVKGLDPVETNSTIWSLFWWNLILAILLIPILVLVHCDVVEGNLAKLIYRGILCACLIFCIAQLLYLLHPLLWGAAKFPSMVDRLFMEAYPRDEYHLNSMKERFACEFETHAVLVQFDLQTPCIPKMKNSLFPTYTVLLLILIDILPFLYAIFTYAWDAVPFPKHNQYEPPAKYAPKSNRPFHRHKTERGYFKNEKEMEVLKAVVEEDEEEKDQRDEDEEVKEKKHRLYMDNNNSVQLNHYLLV